MIIVQLFEKNYLGYDSARVTMVHDSHNFLSASQDKLIKHLTSLFNLDVFFSRSIINPIF